MKPLDPIQFDRHDCEVPGCTNLGTDWDHNIFKRNKRFSKYVNNPLNMLRACADCNRITHLCDTTEVKKWLIDYHMEHNRKEFIEWFRDKPPKLRPDDLFVINNYFLYQLTEEERTEDD